MNEREDGIQGIGSEKKIIPNCTKEKINELLFELLPGTTTIAEMEEIAVKWYREIDKKYEMKL